MTVFEKCWGFYTGKGLAIKMEETECSETSAYKIQTPGNYPEESILLYFFIFHYVLNTLVCMLSGDGGWPSKHVE